MIMLLQVIKNPAVQVALQVGADQIKKYIGNQIDKKIILHAQNRIEGEINSFLESLWRKSKIYFVLLVINLICLLLLYYFKNPYFSLASALISFSFIAYSSYQFIKGFIRKVNYIENFEEHLKSLIEDEFKKAKTENWKNQFLIFLDSNSSNDYYHLILDQVIKVTSSWLKQNKSIFYIRMAFYFVSSLCLSLSIRESLAYWL